jgi:restriction system protein
VFAAIGAFVVVVVVLGAVMTVRRTRRLARSGIGEIDRMDGRTFEERLAVLFRQLGYKVDLVGRTGDFGADLVVSRDGARCAVQAKQRSRGSVGIKAVQEVVGSLPHHRCQRGLVVTNQRFTTAARQLAREHGVQLWEREALIGQLLRVQRRDGPA